MANTPSQSAFPAGKDRFSCSTSADFTFSETGVLVYSHADESARLVWLNREGKPSPVNVPPGTYRMPRLSPDGKSLAISHAEAQSGNVDIWLIDLLRGVPTRFTFDPAADLFPLWSPDGNLILFGSARASGPTLYLKAVNRGADEEAILTAEKSKGQAAYDWSPDGRYVLYMSIGNRAAARTCGLST